MRLGVMEQSAAQPSLTGVAPSPSAPQSAVQFEAPLPNTASLLVISTIGLIGALKVATGFLLAVAPLAFFSLLFEGTIGLFNGWVRAICGLALAVVGANVVTAIDLVLVESELAHVQQSRIPGFSSVFDPQALTTIVALFFLAALVSMFAAMRMGSALGLTFTRSLSPKRHSAANGMHFASEHTAARSQSAEPGSTAEPAQFGRAAIIAGSLKKSVEREKTGPFVSAAAAKHGSREIDGAVNGRVRQPLQPRRGHARRTRIAARRDGRV
jgi:type IV secretion system protein VirB6